MDFKKQLRKQRFKTGAAAVLAFGGIVYFGSNLPSCKPADKITTDDKAPHDPRPDDFTPSYEQDPEDYGFDEFLYSYSDPDSLEQQRDEITGKTLGELFGAAQYRYHREGFKHLWQTEQGLRAALYSDMAGEVANEQALEDFVRSWTDHNEGTDYGFELRLKGAVVFCGSVTNGQEISYLLLDGEITRTDDRGNTAVIPAVYLLHYVPDTLAALDEIASRGW